MVDVLGIYIKKGTRNGFRGCKTLNKANRIYIETKLKEVLQVEKQ